MATESSGVVPIELPPAEISVREDEDEESDESAPLSPNQPPKSYGAAMAVEADKLEEERNTDDIDPFTFEPPFKFWHKLLVSRATERATS